MKTEIQVAKMNVEKVKERMNGCVDCKRIGLCNFHLSDCQECISHKQTCQRILERLQNTNPKGFPSDTLLERLIDRIINDLKQAIEIHNENGI